LDRIKDLKRQGGAGVVTGADRRQQANHIDGALRSGGIAQLLLGQRMQHIAGVVSLAQNPVLAAHHGRRSTPTPVHLKGLGNAAVAWCSADQ
jgi:hypothetical protein